MKNSPELVFEHIAKILNKIAETGNNIPLELSLGKLKPRPKPSTPKRPKNIRSLCILRKIPTIVTKRTFKKIRQEINMTQAT